MLRKLSITLVLLCAIVGCHHPRPLVGDNPQELVGTWQLLIRSSCKQYEVESDVLVLRPDGTFDQRVALRNGAKKENNDQHWSYSADGDHGHIILDKRLEFFTPEMFNSRIGEGTRIGENLILQINPEPVILLHPDSDCVYVKSR